MPLYFSAIDEASPLEILAHRIVWSLVFTIVLLAVLKRITLTINVFKDWSLLKVLGIATVLILINWLTYITAVSTGNVLEAALGYYINPLVTVLLAIVVLRERVPPTTWIALGIGAIAVIVMTVGSGKVPWISFILAVSFGLYGLAKKNIGSRVDAIVSLSVETALSTPLAVGFLIWLTLTSQSTFTGYGLTHTLLLSFAGIMTGLPLILFGHSARLLPLATLGLLQYIGPTIQFLVGILIFHESMPPSRWIGFALVWLAIMVFTFGALSHKGIPPLARRAPRTPRKLGS